jgi:hypothetical protein
MGNSGKLAEKPACLNFLWVHYLLAASGTALTR